MTKIREGEVYGCPRGYLWWAYVVVGMSFFFTVYLVYITTREEPVPTLSVIENLRPTSSLVLTEHINEEDDYEKPVCKRLEESGERYDQQNESYYGEI